MGWFRDRVSSTASGVGNAAKTINDRVSRAARPQDLIPSLGKAIRPQDVVPSIIRLSDPSNWDDFWVERRDALKDWMIRRSASLWMEPPTLKLVNPGNHSGDPIVYVNGLNTLEEEAIQDAHFMSLVLGRPVQLLYNPSNTRQLGEDAGIVADGVEAFFDSIYTPPMPQLNHTTRQLTHLLYHNRDRLSLVTHSQGCLIARNAIHTLWFLGEADLIEDNLAWIAAGSPVNRNTIRVQPARFKDLLIVGDFVGQVLGMKFGKEWYHFYRRRHEFVHEKIRDEATGAVEPQHAGRDPDKIDYLALINLQENRNALWDVGSFQMTAPHRIYAKYPVFVNETDDDLSVEYMRQSADGNSWFFDREVRSIRVEARTRLEFPVRTQKLRLRATAGSHQWDLWEPPIELVPSTGEMTNSERPQYVIFFTAQSNPNEGSDCFGRERSDSDPEQFWNWYSVSKQSALRRGGPKLLEFFEEAMVMPTSLSGSPFQNADEIYRNHFGYFRRWPESQNVWFLPKGGDGTVWIYDPPSTWIREGYIGEYDPSPGSPFGENDIDDYPDARIETPGILMAVHAIRRSSWNTSFTVNGQTNQVRLEFDGESGRYGSQNSFDGQLADIAYRLTDDEDQFIINGKWRRNSQWGIFDFRISTTSGNQFGLLSQFTGHWWREEGLGPPAGDWYGERADLRYAFVRIRNATSRQIRFGLSHGPNTPTNQIQLNPGEHTIESSSFIGEMSDDKIIYTPGLGLPEVEVSPRYEIGFTFPHSPTWRTLSSLDPTKMIVHEFVPRGFGGMALTILTKHEDGHEELEFI